MLNRFRPSRLLAHAERIDLSVPAAGVPADGIGDLELLEELPQRRVDADYNAWWCCLVPSEVLAEVGLPLPIFYQWDDIELGTRARRRGIPTVTLPGAAVWHDDFVSKDGDNAVAYFWRRNSLVVAALHGEISPSLVNGLATELRQLTAEHRYGKVATFLAGIEAFLAGPGVLETPPADTLAVVVAMRAEHPDTRRLSMAELAERGLLPVVVDRDHGQPSRPDLVLRKRLLRQRFDRVGGVVAAASDAPWWHVSRFRTVVITDRSQRDVRVLELDVVRHRESLRAIRRTTRRLRREGGRATEAWRAAVPGLTGAESWRRRFDAPVER
jgi:galactofuranosylgalactofuranosylrhamnosyl-N-acetylglucosaminyl-diphospho-decaprenol beta-1,5/1,6-galactofuranosyltransferase